MASKKKVLLRVGKQMRLVRNKQGNLPVLSNYPSMDSRHLFAEKALTEDYVRVTGISVNRRELSGHEWWVEVEQVSDPSLFGWILFDVGENATIHELVAVPKPIKVS